MRVTTRRPVIQPPSKPSGWHAKCCFISGIPLCIYAFANPHHVMRSFLPIFAITAFLAGCATSPAPVKAPPSGRTSGSKHLTVRTTAYTHTEPGGRNNAIGTRLRFGGATYSAASDWSWMPLGTRFYMPCTDRTYVIED